MSNFKLLTVGAFLFVVAFVYSAPTNTTQTNLRQTALGDEQHYGDPFKEACLSDEGNITLAGAHHNASVCAPKCSASDPCPHAPAHILAMPECILKAENSTTQYCGLVCIPTQPLEECGPTAVCQSVAGNIGVCVYFPGKAED